MKSNLKSKPLILITLGILFAISPLINNNFNFHWEVSDLSSHNRNEMNSENEDLKISAVSGKIHIDSNSGWVDFRSAGYCTGNGTYSEPYVIEDLIIDGGDSGSCILIENSNVHFKIENCTVYHSGWAQSSLQADFTGIKLQEVSNGTLISNTASNNSIGIYLSSINNIVISGNTANYNSRGILLEYSNNNNISGNTANNDGWSGIYLDVSNNNTISGNTANNCGDGIHLTSSNNNTISGNTANNNAYGIFLLSSNNNTVSGNTANNNYYGIALYYYDNYNIISGNNASYNGVGILLGQYCNQNTLVENIMNECGLQRRRYYSHLIPNDIDTTNLVNGKPLFYYTNEINLGSSNFTNAGQVFLINCTNSLISNLNTSSCSSGITLYSCNNNNLSGNTASNNMYGIKLYQSDNNTVSGNTVNNNTQFGIYLYYYSDYNIISGNTVNNNTQYGIYLRQACNNNDITGNTANSNEHGIDLYDSGDNHILTNIITNNIVGIYIYHSYNKLYNEISNNTFSGNGVNIQEVWDPPPNPYYSQFIVYTIIISGNAVIGVAILLFFRRKRKRMQ